MNINKIFFYTAIFISFIIAFFVAGKYIKRVPLNVAKIINWISFGIMVISGILWYFKGNEIYQYILFGSIILYFIFYNYDSKKG